MSNDARVVRGLASGCRLLMRVLGEGRLVRFAPWFSWYGWVIAISLNRTGLVRSWVSRRGAVHGYGSGAGLACGVSGESTSGLVWAWFGRVWAGRRVEGLEHAKV